MDGTFLTNLTAMVVSVLALTVSAFFASRQLRSAQTSTSVAVTIELLTRERRSDEFLESEDYVLRRLPVEHAPHGGVSGLPLEARKHVERVGLYYASLGMMSVFTAISDEMLISTVGIYRISRIWELLEPYITVERGLRKASYLAFFEHLAVLAAKADVPALHRRLGLRKFGPDVRRFWGNHPGMEQLHTVPEKEVADGQ